MMFVNVDDENSILRMNALLFSKNGMQLNCCINQKELTDTLVQYYSNYIMNSSTHRPKIVILIDHVLDNTTGVEVLIAIKKMQLKFDLDINWVLLSSTEDKKTLSN